MVLAKSNNYFKLFLANLGRDSVWPAQAQPATGNAHFAQVALVLLARVTIAARHWMRLNPIVEHFRGIGIFCLFRMCRGGNVDIFSYE